MKELIKDIKLTDATRKKWLLTLLILFALRIGYVIPMPFINREYMSAILSTDGFSFLNLLSGNSLENMSLFALSISPYITASIILQLLAVVIEPLGNLSRGDKTDRDKYERITFFTGIGMALLQSVAFAFSFGRSGLFTTYTWYTVLIAVLVWTVGATFLMWVGKRITDKLVGNGISLILLFNILASMPSTFKTIFEVAWTGRSVPMGIVLSLVIVLAVCVFLGYTVVLELTQKKIPITYSRRLVGSYNDSFFPVRLNMCGVLPIIFTSTILSVPSMIAQFFTVDYTKWYGQLILFLSPGQWFNPHRFYYTVGVLIYIALAYMFTFFYLSITMDPNEIAENLKEAGAVIPGIRPGKPTAEKMRKEMNITAFLGTSMMLVMIIALMVIGGTTGITSISYAGTSIVIIVSVILETYNTLKSFSGYSLVQVNSLFGGSSNAKKVS